MFKCALQFTERSEASHERENGWRERASDTWPSINDNFLNLILARSLTAGYFQNGS